MSAISPVEMLLAGAFAALSATNKALSGSARIDLTASNANDDDQYVYKTDGEIFMQCGPSDWVGDIPPGYHVAKGMRAKCIGLWHPIDGNGRFDSLREQVLRGEFHEAQREMNRARLMRGVRS